MTVYRWHCPPMYDLKPREPWCDDLPCRGHRATKAQLHTAAVLAWGDGHDNLYAPDGDPQMQADYLVTAVEALHDITRWQR